MSAARLRIEVSETAAEFFFVGDAATDSDEQINGPDGPDARCTCFQTGRTWNRRDKCHTLPNLFLLSV
jgi:hypothetical protein